LSLTSFLTKQTHAFVGLSFIALPRNLFGMKTNLTVASTFGSLFSIIITYGLQMSRWNLRIDM